MTRWIGRVLAACFALVLIDIVAALVRARATPATRVVDRRTGEPVAERRPAVEQALIALVWSTVTGSRLLCRFRPFLDYLSRMTEATGRAMDAPSSREKIARFVAAYQVDLADLDRDLTEFATMNEFFSRPLRAGSRPVAAPDDPSIAVSPADCRLRCVDRLGADSSLVVKARDHSVRSLLGLDRRTMRDDPGCAAVAAFHDRTEPTGFAAMICRLAPADYHRYHWPVDGLWDADTGVDIAGEYHSVSPTAVNSAVDVLGVNHRRVVLVETEAFGTVAIVIVGATRVGSILLTATSGAVERGDELGLFRFGGSTVVMLFDSSRIALDDDLRAASADGFEMMVRMGDSIGRAVGSAS